MTNEKNQEKNQEMVEISRSDLKSLMERVQRLENPGEVNLDEPTVHHVNVRLYEGRPISRVFDVKCSGVDEVTGDEKMECKLEVVGDNGKTEIVKTDYLAMIRNFHTVKCELVKRNDKESHKDFGKVAVKAVEGHNMVSTGMMVPLRVTSVEHSYVVKTPDGKEVELKTLNI